MNRKIVLALLTAAVLYGAAGCRREGADTKKQAATPQKGEPNAARSQPPTTVGGQQPGTGTAQQPPAGTAPQAGTGTAQRSQAGTAKPPAPVGETDANQTTAPRAQVPPSQP